MKAYVLEGINRLVFKEIDKPSLKVGYVLLEVKAAGICGSDVPRVFTTGTYHFPTIPGHEFAGVVIDAFDDSAREWIGKRVGVFPLIPCQNCDCCKEKKYEMCSNYNYLGSRCDGGFTEYVAVPVWNLIELPDNVDFTEAAMLEPASVALHAVRRLDLENISSVALFGLGTIGIIIAQWLRVYGIRTVIATGHSVRHGNVINSVASEGYVYLDVSVRATKDDWHIVLQECAAGNLHLKELITHALDFDELQKGLNIMKNCTEYRNKVMICK